MIWRFSGLFLYNISDKPVKNKKSCGKIPERLLKRDSSTVFFIISIIIFEFASSQSDVLLPKLFLKFCKFSREISHRNFYFHKVADYRFHSGWFNLRRVRLTCDVASQNLLKVNCAKNFKGIHCQCWTSFSLFLRSRVYLSKYINLELYKFSKHENSNNIFDYNYRTFLLPLNKLYLIDWYIFPQNDGFAKLGILKYCFFHS